MCSIAQSDDTNLATGSTNGEFRTRKVLGTASRVEDEALVPGECDRV